jgi:membrane-bound serine protease (ClpP class)
MVSFGARLAFLLVLILIFPVNAAKVVEVEVKGEINEGTAIAIDEAFKVASQVEADAVLLTINTPGGLVSSTEKIVLAILNSDVPVITYVYPLGAFSASAGSFILISGHVAAMSNGTSVGAATPVGIYTVENKTINYIASYARSIAEERGRPKDIAEKFVTESLSLSAREAYEKGVVDVLADSKNELFKKIDGKVVRAKGGNVTLNLENVEIVQVSKPLKASIFEVLSNPQIASILFLIGLYGLIFGFTSPSIVPETAGVICLILSLIGFGVISINYIAVILILFGVCFLIAELFTPTYGVLGAASIVCVTLGAIMLFKEPLMPKNFYSSFPLFIAGITLGLAGIMTFFLIKISQLKRVSKGDIVGEKGEVIDFKDGKGYAKIRGEIWKIESKDELKPKDKIVVADRDGLTLFVRRDKNEH